MAPNKPATVLDLYKKVKRTGNFRRKIKKHAQELLCGSNAKIRVENITNDLPTTFDEGDDEHENGIEPR